MDSGTLYVVGIASYIIIMLIIGYYAARKIKSAEDFIVAGRRMPLWLVTATLFATWFGGGTVLGGAGTAYVEGIWNTEDAWGVIPDPFGAGLCLILAGLFFMHKLRKLKLLTLADFYMMRYGKVALVIAAILLGPIFMFWLSVQIIAFGKVLTALLGWPYVWAIILSSIVMLIYTFAGGLWAVALTDFVQMLILTIGTAILAVYSTQLAGGFQAIPADKLQFIPTEHTFEAWMAWVGAWIIIGLGSIPTPDLHQRALGSKDEKTARLGAIFAGILYWTIGFLPVLIGLVAPALVAKGLIPAGPLEEDPELLVPLMVKALLNPVVGTIILGALIAAIMSSADSALLAISTVLTKNLGRDLMKIGRTDRGLLIATRTATVVVMFMALLVAFVFPYVYELMAYAFDLILAALFVPLVLGLYWRKTNEVGAVAGMLAGILYRTIAAGVIEGFTFETITYPANWYYYTIGAPIISLIVTIVVSLATGKINPPKEIHTTQ